MNAPFFLFHNPESKKDLIRKNTTWCMFRCIGLDLIFSFEKEYFFPSGLRRSRTMVVLQMKLQ